jgi:hypothetical protein
MKPQLRLSGTDGNAFSVIGKVNKVLKQSGQSEKAKEFMSKAMIAESYDALLALTFEYVEVS